MTQTWEPCFACPECHAPIAMLAGDARLECGACGERFERREGVYDFLSSGRAHQKAAFLDQYRRVREADGYRSVSPSDYRALPDVDAAHPRANDWRIRRESYEHLLRHLKHREARRWRVLDLGAGSGWLSHRLSEQGHEVVAVDTLADEQDGLGACRVYDTRFCIVRADFDALPFEPGQFDLAVFNASLHYAPDPRQTLAEARRVLRPSGVIAVMDSPMFSRDCDGAAMAEEQSAAMRDRAGLATVDRPGRGFLTFDGLGSAAARLGLRSGFTPSTGSLLWRLRRQASRRRLGRAPAAFGVWVAQ